MKELNALEPGDPLINNLEWPTFGLTDAVVTSTAGNLVNLFEVFQNGTCMIKGMLEVLDEEWRSKVITNNAYNSKHVVEDVTYWSTERTPEDVIQIWALGKACWYLLSPAPEYKAIHEQMKESGRLWHFISDKYMGRITKRLRDEDMEVVRKEAAEEEPGLGSSSTIMQLFNKHRRFLIMKMMEEPKKYHQTPLWKYYMKNYRNDVDDVERLFKTGPLTTISSITKIKSESPADDVNLAIKTKSRSKEPSHNIHNNNNSNNTINDDKEEPKLVKATRSAKVTDFAMISYELGTPKINKQSTSSSSPSQSPDSRGTKRKSSDMQQQLNYDEPRRRTRSSAEDFDEISLKTPDFRRPKHSGKRSSILRPTGMIQTSPDPDSSPFGAGEKLIMTGFDRHISLRSGISKPMVSNLQSRLRQSVFKDDDNGEQASAQLLKENPEEYNACRSQAIGKLSRLHLMYASCSKNWSKLYPRYRKEYTELCEWRKEHKLKPIYIDVVHMRGHSETDNEWDNVVLERIPDTEYLIDVNKWDYETGQEFLININRGSNVFSQELLRPVREGRKNLTLQPKHPNNNIKKTSNIVNILRPISTKQQEGSQRAQESAVTEWHCAGYDAQQNRCTYTIEDATSEEGKKLVAKHWVTCPMRKFQTQQLLQKKQVTVQTARHTLQEIQTERPLDGIDNLINWVERAARKSLSWNRPEQF